MRTKADTGPLRDPTQPPEQGAEQKRSLFSPLFQGNFSKKSRKEPLFPPFFKKHQYKIKKKQVNTLESDLILKSILKFNAKICTIFVAFARSIENFPFIFYFFPFQNLAAPRVKSCILPCMRKH